MDHCLPAGQKHTLHQPTVSQPSPFLNCLLEVCCCAQPWSRREHFTEAWALQLGWLSCSLPTTLGVVLSVFWLSQLLCSCGRALLHPDTELLVWNLVLVAGGSILPSSPADRVLSVFCSCYFLDSQRCPVYPVPACVCLHILLWDGREDLVL